MGETDSVTFRVSFLGVLSYVAAYGLSIGLGIGLLLTLLAGDHIPAEGWAVAAVAGLLVGAVLVGIMVAVFSTKVSAAGIRAFDVWGFPHVVAWVDMTTARRLNMGGLKFLRVSSDAKGRPLWIPLFHRRQVEFVAAVTSLAPVGNVMRSHLEQTGA